MVLVSHKLDEVLYATDDITIIARAKSWTNGVQSTRMPQPWLGRWSVEKCLFDPNGLRWVFT